MAHDPAHNAGSIGMHATVHFPQDTYGAVISGVDGEMPAGARRMTLTMLQPVSVDTGHEPVRREGGYPVWEHTYTTEEAKEMATKEYESIVPDAEGRWVTGDGAVVTFGQATYRRDMSA